MLAFHIFYTLSWQSGQAMLEKAKECKKREACINPLHSLLKMQMVQDFQFYNMARIQELFNKESAYEEFKSIQAQKEQAARQQVGFILQYLSGIVANRTSRCIFLSLSALLLQQGSQLRPLPSAKTAAAAVLSTDHDMMPFTVMQSQR